jgi:hypothetical protein
MCNIFRQVIFLLQNQHLFSYKICRVSFSCPKTPFLLQNHQIKFVATLSQVRLNVLLVVLNLFTLLMVYLHARPEGTALRQQEEL